MYCRTTSNHAALLLERLAKLVISLEEFDVGWQHVRTYEHVDMLKLIRTAIISGDTLY